MHPQYVGWAQKEVQRRQGESGWQLRQLAAWAQRMQNLEENSPTKRQNMGYKEQYKTAPNTDKVMVDTDEQDAKMKDMMTKMAEMQEELNELKGRARKKTAASSQSDGSFEAVQA